MGIFFLEEFNSEGEKNDKAGKVNRPSHDHKGDLTPIVPGIRKVELTSFFCFKGSDFRNGL